MHRNQDIINHAIMGHEPSMYELFDYLRDNDPVSYLEHPDYEPFWVLTRHEDIRHVSHNNDKFNQREAFLARLSIQYPLGAGLGEIGLEKAHFNNS